MNVPCVHNVNCDNAAVNSLAHGRAFNPTLGKLAGYENYESATIKKNERTQYRRTEASAAQDGTVCCSEAPAKGKATLRYGIKGRGNKRGETYRDAGGGEGTPSVVGGGDRGRSAGAMRERSGLAVSQAALLLHTCCRLMVKRELGEVFTPCPPRHRLGQR